MNQDHCLIRFLPLAAGRIAASLRTGRGRTTALLAVAAALGWTAPPVFAEGEPRVRVENVRRAFHNGEHNAFTDLIRWSGKFWLTFRSSPDGHGVFSSASVIILSSPDAQTWTQVHRFSVPGRDTRDPHFLIFKDKLFVYSGTWSLAEGRRNDWNSHLGYATWSSDGSNWAPPHALEGTYGHYIWRAAAHEGKAYLVGRRWKEHRRGADRTTMQAALLQSDDGLRWRFVSLFQETLGNETSFLFEPDGELIGVSRQQDIDGRSREFSILTRSRPPYREWTRENLPGYIGGPVLARWGDRFVVGGRRITPQGSRTVLMWLAGTDLVPFAELPSGGDNSYPGFVELDDGRGLVSWYSSHERDAEGKTITAIYLAELVREN